MSEKRRILDRLFQLGTPAVVEDFRPSPSRLAEGVWSLERRLRMPGAPVLPARTTIVRVASGALALISPPPPHPDTFAAIDALGPVEMLLAPNSFHYLYVGDAMRQYSGAKLYLAPGLQARVPSLPPGIEVGPDVALPGFEHVVLSPGRGISEVILFHQPSRILLLTDCAFNMTHIERPFDRLFWRVFGVPAGLGPSRTARLMLLSSRQRAAQALRQVLAWPFERILVAHGEVVQTDARARFERAFTRYL